LYCNCCGRACERVHEHVQRTVRDLPLFDAITYLDIDIKVAPKQNLQVQ